MGTPNISSKSLLLSCVLYAFLLLCPFCICSKNDRAVEGTKAYFHTLKVSSLPPSNVCNESSKVLNKGSSSLKVVHKYGPCNPHKTSIARPSLTEILRRDKVRVESIIQAKQSRNLRVPFYSTGGDYIVNVDFGRPKKELPLIFDTGSGIIWTQCKRCKPCYDKEAPLFDPAKSTSFKAIQCSSKKCQSIAASSCSSSKCPFQISYVDNTTISGFYGLETISLKPSQDNFKNILVACADKSFNAKVNGESGIIGLDRSSTSFPSQTADKYNKLFSYCIPSNPAATGHLTFGGQVPKDVKFSPLSKTSPAEEYDIEMTGISVGGRKLYIKASAFKISSTIDSGTVLTALPPKTYSVLRSMFQEMMKGYPRKSKGKFLCYNFRNYTTVTIPAITVFFKGGVAVDIDVSGIMIRDEAKVYCLAFQPLDSETAIFGNVQQQTYRVVFDGAKERIGFVPGGCN